MNKKEKILLISVLFFSSVAIILLGLNLMNSSTNLKNTTLSNKKLNNNTDSSNNNHSNEINNTINNDKYDDSTSHKPSPNTKNQNYFDSIVFSGDSLNLTISYKDGIDEIEYDQNYSDIQIDSYISDGILKYTIYTNNTTVFFSGDKFFNLYIPKTMKFPLTFNFKSLNFYSDSISNDITLDCISSNINIKNSSSSSINIDSTTMNLKLSYLKFLNSNLNIDSGPSTVTILFPEDLSADFNIDAHSGIINSNFLSMKAFSRTPQTQTVGYGDSSVSISINGGLLYLNSK